ncbi:MAG TPA: DegT/DnrJ/EryC1/StrS family aminotransferase [Acidimicrobiales bacterium]|nr:DegT/DnrJ/EryC1/StrS family aminotransferase [Acidimicrobiales bacterium]
MSVRARIPLARPLTGEEELAEIREVLESGHLSQGPKTGEFEGMVAQVAGTTFALATSSCTTALHLSLVALGVGPGDEVLVPDFTFPATANVVIQCGARPVLVDIDLATYNVDPDELTKHLTSRTRAVIPVHLFGLAAEMDAVTAFAREHGLRVIEDAACALGASYRGRPCGSFGEVGCFSFHARKVVTTGEGGMVVTSRPELVERLQVLRSHGGVRRDERFLFGEAGFNYRLSDIHAAVGVAQMRRLGDIVARRRALAARYRSALDGMAGITPPSEPEGSSHVYQAFVALLDPGIDRDAVVAGMRAHAVETTIGTYALHDQPFFRRDYGYTGAELPRSHRAFLGTLALPLYPAMDEGDVDAVVRSLEQVLATVS